MVRGNIGVLQDALEFGAQRLDSGDRVAALKALQTGQEHGFTLVKQRVLKPARAKAIDTISGEFLKQQHTDFSTSSPLITVP